MPYSDLVSRAWSMAWRHRYLWLLAFLGGSSTGGTSFRYSTGSGSFSQDQLRSLGNWIGAHAALLLGLGALLVVIFLILFFVSCVAEPALIRSSAELDAERPWSHGLAWRAGWRRFAPILGLRLLALLYVLVVVGVLTGLITLTVLAFAGHQAAAGVLLVLLSVGVGLAVIVLSAWLSIGYVLGVRGIVLEGMGPVAGLRHGLGLLHARPSRVLLVWLLSIGLSWACALVVGVAALVLALAPAMAAVSAFEAGRWDSAFAFGGLAVLLALAVAAVAGGFAGAFVSSYWTLAYRRMEWP